MWLINSTSHTHTHILWLSLTFEVLQRFQSLQHDEQMHNKPRATALVCLFSSLVSLFCLPPSLCSVEQLKAGAAQLQLVQGVWPRDVS